MKQILSELGFNANEIKVYLSLIKLQKATPAEIAKATKINRPTVYNIAKKLASRGLVIEDLGGKTLTLTPAPPSELLHIIKKEESEFQSKAKLLENLSDELTNLVAGTTYAVPKIRFIEEANFEDYLYTQSPIWSESMLTHDATWWGFQDQSLIELYQEWIAWYWKTAPKEIHLKLLTNQSDIEKKLEGKYERRAVRFWKNSQNFSAGTWILGDYVVMTVTNQKPFYLVEIHDKTMAHNFREIFKGLWSMVG